MGKKIFITYGNSKYYNSLKRIKREAIESNEFDEIKIYTDTDLPLDITNHSLFSYKRGGGYWLWKPYICLDALKECGEDDIIIYSDCGNKVFKHKEWHKYWEWCEKYSAIFFYYGASMEERTRCNLLNFFTKDVPFLKHMYQLQSGFLILNKSSISLIQNWLECMMFHPEFVLDVNPDEIGKESKKFIEHRHDQAILSCLVYKHINKLNLFVTRQRSERFHRGGQAIYNARISDENIRSDAKLEPITSLLIRILFVIPFRKIKMKILFYLNEIYIS